MCNQCYIDGGTAVAKGNVRCDPPPQKKRVRKEAGDEDKHDSEDELVQPVCAGAPSLQEARAREPPAELKVKEEIELKVKEEITTVAAVQHVGCLQEGAQRYRINGKQGLVAPVDTSAGSALECGCTVWFPKIMISVNIESAMFKCSLCGEKYYIGSV